jgi:hypothetical protein
MDGGYVEFLRLLLATWKPVIGKRNIGPNEHFVAHAQPVPQLHAAFDGNTIPYHHVVLDQAMGANVTVLPDLGSGKNNNELRKNLRMRMRVRVRRTARTSSFNDKRRYKAPKDI